MPRWESDPQGRLERAALDLFEQQGYDRTTVDQIAREAGLTERSFYRWYADKREVLFGGGAELVDVYVAAIESAPTKLGALDVLLFAYPAAEQIFRPRAFLARRREVILANPALQERELIKFAAIDAALAGALIARGEEPGTARMATAAGAAIVGRASERYFAEEGADFTALIAESADELRGVMRATRIRRPRAGTGSPRS
jgi:AcrR family transcriptional regulator